MTFFFDVLSLIDRHICKGIPFRPFYWKVVHRLLNRAIKFKIKHYRGIEGWLSPNEASALYLLSRLLPPRKTILEIGCWKGKSIYCLAAGLRKGGRLIAMDPFDGSGEPGSHEIYEEKKGETPLLNQFLENMKRLGVSNRIKPLIGLSSQFVGWFWEIDLLFIDGDHSIQGCDFDFLNFSSLIPPGGFLAFHDFNESRKDLGSTWVIKNRVLPSEDYEFWGIFDSLWVAQKL